jgi:hypothetical protein
VILFLFIASIPGIYLIIVGLFGLIKNADDWRKGSRGLNVNAVMTMGMFVLASVGLVELTLIGVTLKGLFK